MHLSTAYASDLDKVNLNGHKPEVKPPPEPRPIVSTIKLTSLAELITEGIPAPVFFCELLYKSGLHSIAGPPDSGKTTIALKWAVALLKSGHRVLFLDEEGGPEIVAEKLAALGATGDDLRYLSYAAFPALTWTDKDITELLSLVSQVQPDLVLLDSSAPFMAIAGLDENSATDVTRFWSALSPVAREHHAAVLVIDHDKKDGEESRFTRGSGAKLAACDVQFKVKMVIPFSRDQPGELKVTVTKDRRGYLHRDWQVTVKTGTGITVEFTRDTVSNTPVDRLAPLMQKVSDLLAGSPAGLTGNAIEKAVPGNVPAIRAARDKLVDDGFVAVRQTGTARNSPKNYSRVRPFVQSSSKVRPGRGSVSSSFVHRLIGGRTDELGTNPGWRQSSSR